MSAATNKSAQVTKLNALSERFSGFERQMDMETRVRKDSEEAQVNGLRDNVARLEKTLNSEIKRRVEANKALQGMFEMQMATVQDKLEAVFLERFDTLHTSVDTLNDRMEVVEKDFIQSRERYIRDIEDKSAMVLDDVEALHSSFHNELSDRKERETLIVAKVHDLESKTSEQFVQYAKNLDRRYATLHDELLESKNVRQETDKRFQDYIIEEVAALKNALVVESQTRETADDDIVNSLNHYTQSLQAALRVVNQT